MIDCNTYEDGKYIVYVYYNRKVWTLNGLTHRDDDLPAIIYFEGTMSWYKNGVFHREGGPAIQYINGDNFWFENGKLHREDGPAVEFHDGKKLWFLNNKRYNVNSVGELNIATIIE